MKFILDTNFYLHYNHFTECNWRDFLENYELTLLVTPTIMRELDEKKYDLRDHINRRAREIIKIFDSIDEGYSSNTLNCGITVEFAPMDIGRNIDWDSLGLDKLIQDDWIIAEALILKKSSDIELVIVTGDYILKRKARDFGISVKRAPDEWRKKTKDPRDKKIRKLEEIINNNYPDVKLYLENLGEFKIDLQIPMGIKLDINKNYLDDPDGIMSKINEICNAKLSEIEQKDCRYTLFSGFDYIPEDDLKRYQQDILIFLKDFRNYLAELKQLSEDCVSIMEIPLVLANTGGVPGRDIDVVLDFPEYILLQDPPELPTKPELPKKPLTAREKLFSAPAGICLDNIFKQNNMDEIEVVGPIVDKSNGKVKYWIQNLKHNYVVPISIFMRFSEMQRPHPFQIKYSIHVENYPQPIIGSLKVLPIYNNTV